MTGLERQRVEDSEGEGSGLGLLAKRTANFRREFRILDAGVVVQKDDDLAANGGDARVARRGSSPVLRP